MLVTTKSQFKRSHVVTLYYNNSTANFWPMLTKLIPLDIELNPGLISAPTFEKPIYIMGDFNCNILNNETRNSKALLDFCRSFNFSQLITSPTRTTDVSKSLLGIILASNLKKVQKAKVFRSSINDHDLVLKRLRLQPEALRITIQTHFQMMYLKYLGPVSKP